MIPKPTYWTFAFYKQIGSNAIAKSEHFIITKDNENNIYGIAWNPVEEDLDTNISLNFTIDLESGTYILIKKRVDEQNCNPLKTWIDMGAPTYPSKEQVAFLRECARPEIRTNQFKVSKKTMNFDIVLTSNALCYFEIRRIYPEIDRGYNPKCIRGAK